MLRFLSACNFLVSDEWEPFAAVTPSAAAAGLLASRWPAPAGAAFAAGGNATAWTMSFSNNYNGFSGAALVVPCPPSPPDVLYFDLFAGREIVPASLGGGGGGGDDSCSLSLSLAVPADYAAALAAPAAGASGNATLAAFLQRMASMTQRPLSNFSTAQPPQPQQSMTSWGSTPRLGTAPPGMVAVPAAPSWAFSVLCDVYATSGVQFPFESAPTCFHSAVIAVPALFADVSPVTNAAFSSFLAASGYAPQDTHNFLRDWGAAPGARTPPAGWDAKPVTWVDQADAAAFCAHSGKRLPNDFEWQRIFQGDDNRTYPWGLAFNQSCVPVQQEGTSRGPPPDVGSFADSACASPFGALDGAGLVWEWTNQFADLHTSVGLVRGGAYWRPAPTQADVWYPKNDLATVTTLHTHQMLRLMDASYDRHGTVGFRCVADAGAV